MVNASGDYYTTLGVPKSASGKEIKAAYRRLARQVLNFTWGFFVLIFQSSLKDIIEFTFGCKERKIIEN